MLLTPTTSTSSHTAITERLSYYYNDCETENHFHIPYQPNALTTVLPFITGGLRCWLHSALETKWTKKYLAPKSTQLPKDYESH